MTSYYVEENRSQWVLDPNIAYLNHGSFGATPRVILDRQQEFRNMMEEEPVQFMICKLPDLLWRTQCVLGEFVQAKPEDIVLIQNNLKHNWRYICIKQ